ncbi:hypothetical protein [uncultured Brevundimonas sp.]|uniref:hypothetical protein n=1 Tax=uncultured Brevundimonas sp. TaxID=213418 RepID=UPI00262DD581|nr:hypothetical protein [uncultured Brevundimonas sp.]
MADQVLTLPLTDEALERLKAAAHAAGVTPEAYAIAILDRALATGADDVSGGFKVRDNEAVFVMDDALTPWPPNKPYDTAEAERRLAEYDRTGNYVTLEDAMERFERALEAKLAARR